MNTYTDSVVAGPNSQPTKGRGSAHNPTNRFVKIDYIPDPELFDPEAPSPKTQFFKDTTRTIIARNDSPDIPFNVSLNPYRGCEHGCVYCYARPTHEYLGLSSGLDFETIIMVKEDAPDLLHEELSSPRWVPDAISISGVTDPYQPIERRLQLTRKCLEVLAEFRNPMGIVTKNHLVTRDIDVLGELAEFDAAAVFLSITSLDNHLRSVMEPRTSAPNGRLEAVRELSSAGIPTGIMVAPVIPGLNDHEIPEIVEKAAQAGAKFAAFTALRLPYALTDLFEKWLEQHFPARKEKILGRIRTMRGGKLNESQFGKRMRGEGVYVKQISDMFRMVCKRAGMGRGPRLSTAAFRRVGGQGELF